MIPELGHFALILALLTAVVLAIAPFAGAARGDPRWMALAPNAAAGLFVFHLAAFGCLAWAFARNDFSVLYVAANSNALLPLHYRLAAVWGAHEGSLLLWSLILSGWTFAVAAGSRRLPREVSARVLAVLGFLAAGFLLFMLLTSNPFARHLPAAAGGRDLNPLLQDVGLILHPPVLYMGYVGLAVPFAFAVAALAEGRVDTAWTRWTRPWTTVAWTFLTLGIALGSWWAYYELGWGGWWFWDPVENASFIPWLAATALIHSLAVSEKRGAFQAWTVLLAISGFSLSLLGAFLVRSGVLVSVHAFANDPARGVFLLAFLWVTTGGALTLFAWRAGRVSEGGRFALCSRETLLLANNALLATAAATVLLGTLYPLLADSLGLGRLSVGRPYFDRVFVPLMIPLALLLAVGALARWKQDRPARLARLLRGGAAAAAGGAALAAVLAGSAAAALGTALALWIAFATLRSVAGRVRSTRDLLRLPRGFAGMNVAHLGFATALAGVCFVSVFEEERVVRLAPGESAAVAGYEFRFDGVRDVAGPNYRAVRAAIEVTREGRPAARLEPEKRSYASQPQPMTEAAIDPGFTRDLYAALGEPLGGGAWSVRLHYKPFVRWIWLGALLMALGGGLAAADRRYRRRAAGGGASDPPRPLDGGDLSTLAGGRPPAAATRPAARLQDAGAG